MKVVKLRKNQKLYKAGYTHAFRFEGYGPEYGQIIKALNKIYNNRHWRGKYYAWQTECSYRPIRNTPEGHYYSIWWVGIRDAKVATQVLLIKDSL